MDPEARITYVLLSRGDELKTLILTEKPSVARDFAKALNVAPKGEGFFESDDTIITWAIGHLMELKEPSEYEAKWKSWSLESLPILPARLSYKPNAKTKKQLVIVQKQLKRKDLSRIVLATDAGREGELIGRSIILDLNLKADCYRFWTSQALSPSVIIENMNALKPLSDYDRLYYAGRSRQSADWLVGMNLSRLATIRMGDVFSVGRVQTAVLALLVDKREEIDNFKSTPYFVIQAKFKFSAGEFGATWFDPSKKNSEKAENNTHLKTEAEALKVLKNCEGHEAVIKTLSKENKKTPPPPLFSLTELQKVANRLYGFSAKKTLSLAQDLYEKKKCLSYPRTDATVLGTSSFGQTKQLIDLFKKTRPNDFQFFDPAKLDLKNKKVFNDAKLTDHHALIPLKMASLSGDEAKIFDLVVKRFIGVFSKDFEYQETKIHTMVNTENFKSKGQQILCLGWKSLSGGDKESFLPNVQENDRGQVKSLKHQQKMTKPPAEYTEATLLQDMINPARLVKEQKLKKIFRGEVGLGTQATRAQIIETLLMRKYIARKGKNLLALPKGQTLIRNFRTMKLSKVLTNPEETAQWEEKLEQIAQGQGDAREFMLDIRKFVADSAEEWKTASIDMIKTKQSTEGSLGACPLCKAAVIETPKTYGCQRWREGCKFTVWKNIAGKKISKTQAKKILSTGKSDPMKGFKSKAGKAFDATLIVKDDGVKFEFLKE